MRTVAVLERIQFDFDVSFLGYAPLPWIAPRQQILAKRKKVDDQNHIFFMVFNYKKSMFVCLYFCGIEQLWWWEEDKSSSLRYALQGSVGCPLQKPAERVRKR